MRRLSWVSLASMVAIHSADQVRAQGVPAWVVVKAGFLGMVVISSYICASSLHWEEGKEAVKRSLSGRQPTSVSSEWRVDCRENILKTERIRITLVPVFSSVSKNIPLSDWRSDPNERRSVIGNK